jgi:polyisoprenoid-binding protein YceI
MKFSVRLFQAAAMLLVVGKVATADPLTFDFKDPKGVNTVAFLLDSPLEPILGLASGISGQVKFDPQRPESISGHFVLPVTSVLTQIPMMNTQIQSAEWLDAAQYPTIQFLFEEIKGVKKVGQDTFEAAFDADFTCRGITRKVPVKAKATYLPGKLGDRLKGMPGAPAGDLLVVRATFTIARGDFGIKPGQFLDKVAGEVQIQANIVGACPK